MSVRIWTKGITWKKTASKVLGDGTNSGTNYSCNLQNNWSNERSQISQSFSIYSKENSNHFAWTKPYAKLLSTNNKISGSENNFTQALKIHISSFFSESKNSTSSGTDDVSANQEKVDKVGIISSMFKDTNNAQDIAEKPPAVSSSDEKDESKDEKEDEKKESPFLKSQRIAKWVLLGTFAVTTPLLVMEFGPPKRDQFGDPIPDEYSNDPVPLAYVKRAWGEMKLVKKDIEEPSSHKLLPDPLQEPYYQPPYTLVIELFDVLLHPVYDQVHGWRFKKRPGIDYFLSKVGPPVYEIVIFTRETGMTAYPLIDSMDPKGYIMYRLFRDAARFKSGFKLGNILKGEWPKLDPYYQKDIKYLNRDLKRVVVVDNDRRATELQPTNSISLKPWDGSVTDTELYDLAAFLCTIATSEVDDVRPVLEHYGKYDDPLAAFKLAQTKMHEEQEKLAKQMQENKSKSLLSSPSGGFNVLTKFFRPKRLE